MAVHILSITHVAPRFGLANAILFVLPGQLVSAAVIAATGVLGSATCPLTPTRVAGLVVKALGVGLCQRG